MAEVGLEDVVRERAGEHGVNWDNEYTSLHMIAPDYQPIIGYPKAYTASTEGKIEADAVIVEIESEADCKILEVLATNAEPVEFGQALFRVAPRSARRPFVVQTRWGRTTSWAS